ncbi:hypothetical protein B9J07_27740 [Sinorhizobium sp. LM21]|uniref:hypothetical protein n=1 Tax=Sinorhizobium sp. LM21 TaxID=1449788 RepID=UPI0005D89FA0|nr:hypothetical protein [Sinorhizobium sp. LM21]AJW30214.1 hypothetical protein pLM21S1_p94 [Sinorhizobium sp. LM21]OWZ90382.1 hypothetical protein B9J07_27740 [Sinorhizobium sp. LM21]
MAKKITAKTETALEAASAPLDMASFFNQAADAITEMGAEAEALAQLEADSALEEAVKIAGRPLETNEGEIGHFEQTDDGPVWVKFDPATYKAEDETGQSEDGQEGTDPADIDLPAHVPGDLKVMKGDFTLEQKETKKAEVVTEFTQRIAFEKAQPGCSSKMVPNLEAEQKKMATIGAAGLFLAMDIDPSFINREVSTGSRFNVYAFQKVNDLIVALDGGFMQNAINRAIVTSLFNFRDAGIPFTGAAALAAASDKVKADRAMTKHLVRHTVSANTASTQKSSTMTALKTLGIVTNSGTRGAEVWTLTDTPATRRLEQVVRGKIAA